MSQPRMPGLRGMQEAAPAPGRCLDLGPKPQQCGTQGLISDPRPPPSEKLETLVTWEERTLTSTLPRRAFQSRPPESLTSVPLAPRPAAAEFSVHRAWPRPFPSCRAAPGVTSLRSAPWSSSRLSCSLGPGSSKGVIVNFLVSHLGLRTRRLLATEVNTVGLVWSMEFPRRPKESFYFPYSKPLPFFSLLHRLLSSRSSFLTTQVSVTTQIPLFTHSFTHSTKRDQVTSVHPMLCVLLMAEYR